MKHPQSFQLRDGIGIGSLIVITAILYTTGGQLPAVFGLAATVGWVLGPPVFAFALGGAGLAVVATSASVLAVAVGGLAVSGLLISDVKISSPVINWAVAICLGGVVGIAVVLALQRSLTLAAIISIGGIGVFSYAVTIYGKTSTIQTSE